MDVNTGRWVASILFAIAAITDFFDGWAARKFKQTSSFGRFLDPIADKLLVASILLVLPATGRLTMLGLIPAAIILCREIMVSGLREFLAELRVGMPVTKLAKWKTTFQLIALPLLLIGMKAPSGEIVPSIYGEVTLWVAAILTLITGYDYLKAGLKHMSSKPDNLDK
jgi:cardiolipin synthase